MGYLFETQIQSIVESRVSACLEIGKLVQEGIAIAREMFERVRPEVQGVQVSAPFGKVELALQVFEGSLAGKV